jgi:glyoxylase-like metal-dependent hydrolase (beta-lactamase superfamily II)
MTSPLQVSRRDFLKAAGVGALALGVGGSLLRPRAAYAQDGAQPSALYNFALGDLQLTVLQDAVGTLSPDIFGANAPEGAVAAAVADANLPSGDLRMTFNVSLLRNGTDVVLFDTGLGANADNPAQGRLIPTLNLLGITPEDVTHVIISHFHPDHIGGLAAGGTASFPNAAVLFPQGEYDFMNSGNVLEASAGLVSAANAQLALATVGDRLQLYTPETELVTGVQAVAAAGHTPGHSAFLFASGGAQLLALVDSALYAALSVPNPAWAAAFDAIPDIAVETRKALFARAADEQIPVMGYHFPFPGLGYIDRNAESFRFVQATL